MTDHSSVVRRVSRTRPLLANFGRLALVSALIFWWGGIFVPRLTSLIDPDLLASKDIPLQLNPDVEGTFANAVSATALLTVALLVGLTAVASWRLAAGWFAVVGWSVLALTVGYVGWEEAIEPVEVVSLRNAVFNEATPSLWPLLISPLIVAFVLVMVGFVCRGRQLWEVRLLLTLGIVVWLLVLVYEASVPYLSERRAYNLGVLFEETLEFGGTLVIGLSAVVAMRRRELGVFRPRVFVPLVGGSLAVVGLLGGLVGAFVFRAPVVDARPYTHIGTFDISLSDTEAVAQEFRMPAVPIGSLDLRLGLGDPNGRSGAAVWRVLGGGGGEPGPILRAGRLDVPAGEDSTWRTIRFPPLVQPEGRPLTLLVQAEVGQGARLLVGATKTDGSLAGPLWINGERAWSDQTLSTVVYSASEPTRSKVQAIWTFIASDWHWPVVLAGLAIGLTLVTLIPALLVTSVVLSAVPQRS